MSIYIDDSGTSPENAVAVAAGWIANTDSWVDFQTDWDKARDIDGDKFDSMHMAEFVFGQRGTEFEGWSLEKKQRISARLRDLIKDTAQKGFALGISSVAESSPVQVEEPNCTIHRVRGSGRTWERQTLPAMPGSRESQPVTSTSLPTFVLCTPNKKRRPVKFSLISKQRATKGKWICAALWQEC